MRPAWDWDLLDADGQGVGRPTSPAFTNRFDAEAWIGEHWRDLAAQGVAQARLNHHGTPVAPPLPLTRTR